VHLFRFLVELFYILMCFAYISLLSGCMPRYFTSLFWGRSTLRTGLVAMVNVICVDLL
jgi:hypothetical protein